MPEDHKDNVYFEPPDKSEINYPCIIYDLDDVDKLHANDKPYQLNKRYRVMIIELDSETPISNEFLMLPLSSYVDKYKSEGLNHTIHNLYF